MWHRGLISKLTSFGIHGDLHGWISSFLNDRRQSVVLGDFTFPPVLITAGVPPRECHWPFALPRLSCLYWWFGFTLREWSSSFCRRFNTSCRRYKSRPQKYLCRESSTKSGFLTGASQAMPAKSKREEIIISRKRVQNHPLLFFTNSELKPTQSITILGVIITITLTWTPYIAGLAKKAATRARGVLGRTRNLLPLHARIIIYKAYQ